MAGNFAFMKKEGGKIERVPLVKWPKYRQQGYEFCSETDYNAQQSKAAAVEEELEAPTMENTKEEILAYAHAKGIDVDADDTKSELLDWIEEALA